MLIKNFISVNDIWTCKIDFSKNERQGCPLQNRAGSSRGQSRGPQEPVLSQAEGAVPPVSSPNTLLYDLYCTTSKMSPNTLHEQLIELYHQSSLGVFVNFTVPYDLQKKLMELLHQYSHPEHSSVTKIISSMIFQ